MNLPMYVRHLIQHMIIDLLKNFENCITSGKSSKKGVTTVKKKVISPEIQAQMDLERSLKDLLDIPYQPEPTYIFKVGEAVKYGNWDSCDNM